MKFHINRSLNLMDYLEKHGWTEALPTEPSDFSFWDIYITYFYSSIYSLY